MEIYLIVDNTAGNIVKLANASGLIRYANNAHFVNADMDSMVEEWQIRPCKDVKGAIEILKADMFHVIPINFNDKDIIDISDEVYEGK